MHAVQMPVSLLCVPRTWSISAVCTPPLGEKSDLVICVSAFGFSYPSPLCHRFPLCEGPGASVRESPLHDVYLKQEEA